MDKDLKATGTRELSPEEMDKVSGGTGEIQQCWECPDCGTVFNTFYLFFNHVQFECNGRSTPTPLPSPKEPKPAFDDPLPTPL